LALTFSSRKLRRNRTRRPYSPVVRRRSRRRARTRDLPGLAVRVPVREHLVGAGLTFSNISSMIHTRQVHDVLHEKMVMYDTNDAYRCSPSPRRNHAPTLFTTAGAIALPDVRPRHVSALLNTARPRRQTPSHVPIARYFAGDLNRLTTILNSRCT